MKGGISKIKIKQIGAGIKNMAAESEVKGMVCDVSARMTERIRETLDALELRYFTNEGNEYFAFLVRVKHKNYKIIYIINPDDLGIMIRAISTMRVDVKDNKRIRKLAEWMYRLNLNLENGLFNVDSKAGNIFFKKHVDCSKGTIPDKEQIWSEIADVARVYERYGQEIQDIIGNFWKTNGKFSISF